MAYCSTSSMPHCEHVPGVSLDSHLAGQMYFLDRSAAAVAAWLGSAWAALSCAQPAFCSHLAVSQALPDALLLLSALPPHDARAAEIAMAAK